ncbi:MAG: hypothetical protein E7L05_16760, partial [Clostridium sp.]|nr:hypothetical protein [Clostridium sp.]
GIIENYLPLRNWLKGEGYTFKSETDTEVIPNLIDYYYEGDLFKAVTKALKKLEGSYALGVVCKNEPDKLIAVRKECPLIVGLGKGESFIASDIPAVLSYTRDVYLLEDHEIAVLDKNGVKLYTTDGDEITKDIYHVTWSEDAAEKGGFEDFMLKEIHEQPKAIRDTMAGRISMEKSMILDDLKITKEDLENTGDILDWVDNYSIELRKFLNAHKDDGEIQRIQNIPEGKWNYLPKSTDSSQNQDEILGLYRAKGKVSATGVLIEDIGFVSIAKSAASRGPFSSIRPGYIQEQDALQIIQTTPDDNERFSDEISVNRSEYIAEGKAEISVQFESVKPVYSIKQQGNRALEIIKGYFDPSYDLVGIIKKGIRYSNDKRTFEQIVREVNKQNKEYGAVT